MHAWDNVTDYLEHLAVPYQSISKPKKSVFPLKLNEIEFWKYNIYLKKCLLSNI